MIENFRKISVLLLVLFFAVGIFGNLALQPASAQLVPTGVISPDNTSVWSTTIPSGVTPYATIKPQAYLSFSPNPLGVGQTLLVNMWLTSPPAANRYMAGYTVTIVKPDGTKDTVGPMHSYVADGTAWFLYTVDQAGTWQLKFDFPGEYFPAGLYLNGFNDNTTKSTGANNYPSEYYTPASTEWQNLTVQDQPVNSWYSPLPTGYWTRPINVNNREWSTIGGNYPWNGQWMGSSMNGAPRYLGPYITASNTAHILWSQPQAFPAGIIGGEAGNYANTGSVATPSVIFEGRAYATQTTQWTNGSYLSCAVSYDLRTGQLYYAIPTAAPYNGITPTFINYNVVTTSASNLGTAANTAGIQLSTLTNTGLLYTINPLTGAITSNITALPGVYHNGWVVSSQNLGTTANPNWRIINWTTSGTGTFASRIVSNISSPINLAGLLTAGYLTTPYPLSNLDTTNATVMNQPYYSSYQVDLDTGIVIMQGRFTYGNVNGGLLQAWSLTTGQSLWNVSTAETPFNSGTVVANDGIYFSVMEQGIVQAYDEQTGKLLWTTNTADGPGYPWGEFWGYVQASAYGMFYATGYTGIYAFNETTGAIVWHFASQAPPFEQPYTYGNQSVYPFTSSPIVADGKIYVQNTEHTPTSPYARGWSTYALNATTGEQIWKVDNAMTPGAMADGYTTAANSYDGSMYVFGIGKSTTTVSVPQTAITTGTNAVISGTVLDQSAAQPGTPAVSDSSMGAWMSYLHFQSQLPNNITGVPVSIDATDPNGNFVHIGDAVSDMSGTYAYTWTPTNVGDYKITATFPGSNGYGASFAETHANVVQAQPTATSTPAPIQALPDTTMTIVAAAIGLAIIVIIGFAATLLMLKKR